MFTRNWYKIFASHLKNASIGGFVTYGGNTANAEGDNVYQYCQLMGTTGPYVSNISTLMTSLDGYGGVILGTGTVPPTFSDYCLSGNLITEFSYNSNVSAEEDENGVNYTVIYTITNTSDETITIGEVGLIKSLKSTNTGQAYKTLLERTVLDSPVTIEPNGVGQVTYTIRFNYPTA